jgi:hypothetical protein
MSFRKTGIFKIKFRNLHNLSEQLIAPMATFHLMPKINIQFFDGLKKENCQFLPLLEMNIHSLRSLFLEQVTY